MTHTRQRRETLLETYRFSGPPIATVYLPARSDVADASDRYEIRVKNSLSELAALGAEEALVATVESAVADFDHGDGAALAVVATSDEVIVRHPMFRPLSEPLVTLGPTPALLPLLEATQADLPHVAVLLDRVGADVWYRDDLGAPIATRSVSGEELHVQRSQPGGWSQRRFQQIAENTWEDNAKSEVSALVDEAPGAEIVVAGGDVRAVGFFAQHLPARLGELVTVEGSRAATPEPFLDNADTAIRSIAAERLVAAIGECRDAVGEGRAVEGRETLQLLGQGRVERLFVVNDTMAEDRPTASVDFSVPVVTGDGDTECPMTEAAVALAVATGAEVTVVPRAVLDRLLVGVVRG